MIRVLGIALERLLCGRNLSRPQPPMATNACLVLLSFFLVPGDKSAATPPVADSSVFALVEGRSYIF